MYLLYFDKELGLMDCRKYNFLKSKCNYGNYYHNQNSKCHLKKTYQDKHPGTEIH
jgi:hypothetical protein